MTDERYDYLLRFTRWFFREHPDVDRQEVYYRHNALLRELMAKYGIRDEEMEECEFTLFAEIS